MGEEPAGLIESATDEPLDAPTPEQRVVAAKTEVDEIRDDLDDYVAELDRRRHEAVDLKVQFKRHKVVFVALSVALLAALGGLVYVNVRASPRRRSRVAFW